MLIVLLQGLCKQLSFIWILTAGLFDVYMFAIGGAEDCRRRVPMIRRRDHQCIEVGLSDQSPDIGYDCGLAWGIFQSGQAILNGLCFHVADISYFYIG